MSKQNPGQEIAERLAILENGHTGPGAVQPQDDKSDLGSGAGSSGYWDGSSLYQVERSPGEAVLVRWSTRSTDRVLGQDSELERSAGLTRERHSAATLQAETLWKVLPHTQPRALSRYERTFGTGDRLGLAGEAHVRAMSTRAIVPVLAQQSVRELVQTGRSYNDVALAAALGVIEAGYTGPFGFDGDHLKTLEEVDRALAAGCAMITLDLSEHLDVAGGSAAMDTVERLWQGLPELVRREWESVTQAAQASVDRHPVKVSREDTHRTAVTFHRALTFIDAVWERLRSRGGDHVDLEISVDETGADTTPAQHVLLIYALRRREIAIDTLAPKFVGAFEKGVDYYGDLDALARDMKRHGEITASLGGYRLSIHSGSDKFGVFPLVEECVGGRYHLKTSGTFWLEAVRTAAARSPDLFQRVFLRAWENFDHMKALYKLSADPSEIPEIETVPPAEYHQYLTKDSSRQLLHVVYGAVLKDPEDRELLYRGLHENRGLYLENVMTHVERHLQALAVPLKSE
jgi:tagaturonate epimerase